MKVIYNSIIPFRGYKAITIGPWIFARKGATITPSDLRHEQVHWEQEKELAIVPFYIVYALIFAGNFLVCLFNSQRGRTEGGAWRNGTWKRTYRSHPMEREACYAEQDMAYVLFRRHYAWLTGKYDIL